MIRSIMVIGNLWPLCANCNHIAQEHDNDKCSHVGQGQCKCCGKWGYNVPCDCKEYVGPTFEEFKKKYLTSEEIAHYKW